jgi:hypothetical protein
MFLLELKHQISDELYTAYPENQRGIESLLGSLSEAVSNADVDWDAHFLTVQWVE